MTGVLGEPYGIPVQSFSWLIDGIIAGSGFPGRLFLSSVGHTSHPLEKLEIDLRFLRDQGIRAILSLTEQPLDGRPEDVACLGLLATPWDFHAERQALQEFGFDYRHIPIADMTAPGMGDLGLAMEFIETAERKRKPVLVHCAVGRGRTGTVLACYLVQKGFDPAEAIRRVRSRRPGSVETHEQETVVYDYRAAMGGGGNP